MYSNSIIRNAQSNNQQKPVSNNSVDHIFNATVTYYNQNNNSIKTIIISNMNMHVRLFLLLLCTCKYCTLLLRLVKPGNVHIM